MHDRGAELLTEFTARLSRRAALKAYVSPALSVIALTATKNFAPSGVERVQVRERGDNAAGGSGNPNNQNDPAQNAGNPNRQNDPAENAGNQPAAPPANNDGGGGNN